MSEQLHQKISQFIDDELDFHDSLKLLHTLHTQAELHHKLRRYEAIRHALKSGVYLSADSDFSQQIREKIQQHSHHREPVLFEKTDKPTTSWLNQPFAWAASLAMIAVITPYAVTTLNRPKQVVQMELAKQQQQAELAKQQQLELVKQQPLNTQISNYLQAHSQVTHNYPRTDMAVYTQK